MIRKILYKIRKLLYIIAGIIIIAAALGLSYVTYMHFWGNFRVVTSGQFYRSGQMREELLTYYLKKYKIKSVVNLEGSNPNEVWYQGEIKACKQLGVKHYNFALSSSKFIDIKETKTLISLLENAPKPILAHCNGGADRSGFTSAIWDYAVKGENPDEAVKQLSWRYFHLPYLGNPTVVMNKSYWNFVDYKKK